MTIQDPYFVDMAALHDALLALSGTLEPDQTLKNVVEYTERLMNSQVALVGLATQAGAFVIAASIVEDQVSLQSDFTLECREPDSIEKSKSDFLKQISGEYGLASAIVIPLTGGNCFYGFLAAGFTVEHTATAGDEWTMSLLANHTILALKRSLSYSAVRRERDRLQRIVSGAAEDTIVTQRDWTNQPHALTTLLESIPEAIVVVNKTGRVILMNQQTQKLFGSDLAATGKHIADWTEKLKMRNINGQPLTPAEIPVMRALQDEIILDQLVLFANKLTGQDQYARHTAAPIYDEQGKVAGAVLLASDVTRAQELEKLRNDFLSLAGHELKTPITSIKGFGQFVRRRLRQANPEETGSSAALVLAYPKIMDQLETMIGQIDRLTNMINDLLDVSRLQSGRFEYDMSDLNLRDLVAQTVDRIYMSWKDSERIEMQLAEEVVPISGDSIRLDQVITNLVTNALKYSPEGGVVEVNLWTENNQVRFSVRDFGIGISQEDQDKLFSQFYRASNARSEFSGLGLGLFISKEIVTRHGGRIWVESTQGEGSTFHVVLPLRAQDDGRKSRV